MTLPRVLNKTRDVIPSDAVYVGRPSIWGNPFVIGKDGTRKDVIEKYRKHIMTNKQLLDKIKNDLSGKDLVCWCSPKRCHGDILIELANSENLESLFE